MKDISGSSRRERGAPLALSRSIAVPSPPPRRTPRGSEEVCASGGWKSSPVLRPTWQNGLDNQVVIADVLLFCSRAWKKTGERSETRQPRPPGKGPAAGPDPPAGPGMRRQLPHPREQRAPGGARARTPLPAEGRWIRRRGASSSSYYYRQSYRWLILLYACSLYDATAEAP